MKSLNLHLLGIGGLVGFSCTVWAAALNIGQAEIGTIGTTARSNSYNFGANASDVVDFTMTVTSSQTHPGNQTL
jgi:hypothetical protein